MVNGIPVQQACQGVGQGRAPSYRPLVAGAQRDAPMLVALTAVVTASPRWGGWQCERRLRLEGRPWNVNLVGRVYCRRRFNGRPGVFHPTGQSFGMVRLRTGFDKYPSSSMTSNKLGGEENSIIFAYGLERWRSHKAGIPDPLEEGKGVSMECGRRALVERECLRIIINNGHRLRRYGVLAQRKP